MQEYQYKYQPVSGMVSVIIPTHNRADLITETLESFEKQSYDKVEIIVVDDHSIDNTKEVVEVFKSHSRFQIYYIPSDGLGGCHARNIGLINSRGEYIQFFDDDDLVSREFLTKRVESLLEGFDFVTCNFSYFEGNPENKVGIKRLDDIPHTVTDHLRNNSLPTPCFLFKRLALEKMGFWNESVSRLQDMAYYHRIFMYDLHGEWRNECMFNVRWHENNITRKVSFKGMIYAYSQIMNEWKGLNNYKQVAEICTKVMIGILYNNIKKCYSIEWISCLFIVLNKNPIMVFRALCVKCMKL